MQRFELLGKENQENKTRTKLIPIGFLKPSRYQVRDSAFFSKEDLENLASSIRSIGLIELPKVRQSPEDPEYYEIISGHRRIRAASEILGWSEINCEVYDHEDCDESLIFQLCLEENIQRHNLSPYEEGIAFLLSEKMFGFSQDQVSVRFHQSRSTVQSRRQLAISANSYLKYAEPAYANAFLRHVSLGHIACLSKLDTSIIKYALKMIARGATPRHIERFKNIFGKANRDHNDPARDNQVANCEGSIKVRRQVSKTTVENLIQNLDKLKDDSPYQACPRLIAIRISILEIIEIDKNFRDASEYGCHDLLYCPKCGNKIYASSLQS